MREKGGFKLFCSKKKNYSPNTFPKKKKNSQGNVTWKKKKNNYQQVCVKCLEWTNFVPLQQVLNEMMMMRRWLRQWWTGFYVPSLYLVSVTQSQCHWWLRTTKHSFGYHGWLLDPPPRWSLLTRCFVGGGRERVHHFFPLPPTTTTATTTTTTTTLPPERTHTKNARDVWRWYLLSQKKKKQQKSIKNKKTPLLTYFCCVTKKSNQYKWRKIYIYIRKIKKIQIFFSSIVCLGF